MDNKEIIDRLSDKVDSHDKSLVLISKAVEDINKNLDRFATSNEKLTTDMIKHWHMQDKTMDKIEAILQAMANSESRFRSIEDKQINGCPNFNNFVKHRDGELKRWESLADSIAKSIAKNTESIDKLDQLVSVHTEKISVINKRLADIEKWQEKAIVALITNSFGVIGILIATIWSMMK